MSVKYYSLFFLIFCLGLSGGFYALNSNDAQIVLLGFECNFPIAVWIMLSLGIFYLLSLLFFAGGWISKSLLKSQQKRDLDYLILQIHNQILQQNNKQFSFKTPAFKMLSNVLMRLNIFPNLESTSSENEKIDKLFMDLDEIEKGNVVKMDLKKDSYFWEKNSKNKIKADLKFAQKVLEDNEENQSLKEFALNELLQNNAINEKLVLKLLKQNLEPKMAQELLMQFLQKGYKLGMQEMLSLILDANPSQSTFITLAKTIKPLFDPDFCITLFYQLAQENPEARLAYTYILLDFSMKDRAKEFLAEHSDLVLPKLYLELQEDGKNPPLEIFFKE